MPSSACSLPPEYCSYSDNFSKCKPWLLKNYPNLYPELANGTRLWLVVMTEKFAVSSLSSNAFLFSLDPELAALTKQVDGITVIDDNADVAAIAGASVFEV